MKNKEDRKNKEDGIFLIKTPIAFHEEYMSMCKQVGINMSQRVRILLEKDLKTLKEVLEKSI